jgi:NADPH:quinone reductase-like Zn-dependent oxidoreductase
VRAVRIHAHGGPEVLRVEEVPEPEPGPRDLLVRLRATSVNHRDIWIRKGHPHPAYHVDLPAVLGIDVCGDVVTVGPEVDAFGAGDRVTANPYMHCGRCPWCVRGQFQYCPHFSVYNGTYAELFLVPADFAVRVDPSVPDEHVAAFPNTYITAWQMLVGKAAVSAADTVFVWAGTSGLGSAAIEIAKLAGATVITSAGSEEKRARLRELPADAILDHHAAGATSGDDARMNVTYVFAKQLRILGSRLGTMSDTIDAAKHLSAGRFRPLIDREFSLDELGEAHRLMDEGQLIGKAIIRP